MRAGLNRWLIGVSVPLLATARARGDDQISFLHESYIEDHSRMSVNTESLRIHKTFSSWLDITASGVFDAVSGATPTGAPAIDQLTMHRPGTNTPIPSSAITGFSGNLDAVSGASPHSAGISRDTIPLASSHDNRMGGDLDLGLTYGASKFTPAISYSQENDYISWAGSLNYSLELNNKNTVIGAGWSHAYDRLLPVRFAYITQEKVKNTDDFLLGVTQILGPRTVVSANATFSHAEGYLNDPYRSVVFDASPLNAQSQVLLQGENRPGTRDSQSLFLSATQAIPPWNASIEGSYRFYHDSFGIIANTVGLQWFQKIGRTAVIAPSVRYYRQSAASFYGIQFPGDPTFDPSHTPRYYSSDYRLSAFETYTLGLDATFHISEKWDCRLGYHRYWMQGLDHHTRQSVYPAANMFTVGLSYSF
jgi:hypothetical protein